MPFESLGEYVEALDKSGQLKRVKKRVSPHLEIAEIMRRLMYAGNQPAVLFEDVQGYDIPVLGNAFGTITRLQTALEIENFQEIGERIMDLTKLKMPAGMLNKLRMLPKLSEIAQYGPKSVESGPVMEVTQTDNMNLNSIPILKSFPGDAGRFITFGLTVTKHPETGIRNIGVYRIQVINDIKAIMHWQIHKRGAQHYEISKEQMKSMEVAIVIGADPADNISVQSRQSQKVWTSFYLRV